MYPNIIEDKELKDAYYKILPRLPYTREDPFGKLMDALNEALGEIEQLKEDKKGMNLAEIRKKYFPNMVVCENYDCPICHPHKWKPKKETN
jgi:hypothetical protein